MTGQAELKEFIPGNSVQQPEGCWVQSWKTKCSEITPQTKLFIICLGCLCNKLQPYVIAWLYMRAQQNQGEQMQLSDPQTGALLQHKLLSYKSHSKKKKPYF